MRFEQLEPEQEQAAVYTRDYAGLCNRPENSEEKTLNKTIFILFNVYISKDHQPKPLTVMRGSMRFILFVGAISLALTHQANQKQVIDTGILPSDTLVKAVPDNTKVIVDTMPENLDEIKYDKYAVRADLSEFPTLHPIVVPFAVSFVLVSALLQFLNVFLFKKDIAWIVFLLILAGFVAAVISSRSFHPHTTGLAERAAIVVGMHERWAEWTIRTAFLALILQIVHLFTTRFDKSFRSAPYNKHGSENRRARIFMLIIAVIMLASAFSVVRTGRLGAQLVHVEGVGPQGRYLE